MKSINLLPKKPFWKRWFAPLMILLVGIYITVASAMYYNLTSIRWQQQAATEEASRIEQNIALLREQRVPDPKLALLQQFQVTVSQLESSRIDWLPAVQTLTSSLPADATLEKARAEAGTIALEVQFSTLQSVVDYVRKTRSSNLFDDIQITSVTALQQIKLEQLPESASTESAPTVSPVVEPVMTVNPMLEELRQMMMREAEGTGSEIQVNPSLYETFRPEEIDAAVSIIEQWGTGLPQEELAVQETPVAAAQVEVLHYRAVLTYVLAQEEAERGNAP